MGSTAVISEVDWKMVMSASYWQGPYRFCPALQPTSLRQYRTYLTDTRKQQAALSGRPVLVNSWVNFCPSFLITPPSDVNGSLSEMNQFSSVRKRKKESP
jgi:hypothetical protein